MRRLRVRILYKYFLAAKERLTNLMYNWLYIGYYRWLFGRHGALTRQVAPKVHTWAQHHKSDDIPRLAEEWDSQYRKGNWEYMKHLEEVGRYSLITGYIHYLKPGGSVLDVGCGEGVLPQRLNLDNISKYVGIDISQVAINAASQKANEKVIFVNEDVSVYTPMDCFDVIVFNEILYYLEDPLAIVKRYEARLKQDSIFIASLYITERSMAIRRRLNAEYVVLKSYIQKLWMRTKAAYPG